MVPTFGVWNKPEDIEWEKLPNQFVLKTTHGGGGKDVIIVLDKNTIDKKEVIAKLNSSMHHNIYVGGREYPYKNVPHRILAEQYLQDDSGELKDYKFFCFNGQVKALFIASDRYKSKEEVKFDFFDSDFNHLPFTHGHPNAKKIPTKPEKFEEMKQIASVLSEGIPQVRIDLYEVNGKIYFGEMTFYHHSGLVAFNPASWDKTFGNWIELPIKKK